MGIDYGKHKIGMAISEGSLAAGCGSIRVNGLKDAAARILQKCQREGIDQLVVGLPESGEARGMVNKFVAEMRREGVRVETGDETVTTRLAQEDVRKMGGDEDERAAVIILERYLEQIL